jgi:hypothetical protein
MHNKLCLLVDYFDDIAYASAGTRRQRLFETFGEWTHRLAVLCRTLK